MPSEHARLSPSAAERWLNCPGSVALCENVVDHGSRDADEGTACHEVLQKHLIGKPCSVGFETACGIVVTEEHQKLVQPVIEYIEGYRHDHHGAAIFSELRLEIGSHAFGLPEGAMFGTSDVVGLSDELLILDAKFGYVDVPVEENPQLISYGLGALYNTGWMHDRIRLVIAQPRCGEPKEYIYTAADMQRFEDEYRPKAIEAFRGGPLRPSEEACRWCKAQAVCPALKDEMVALAQREMADPLTLSPEEISELLDKGEMIENALRSLRAHAHKLDELGTKIPGWKRVLGDKHRKWRDEKEAARLLDGFHIDMYERSLRSPNQIEELLADKIKETWEPKSIADAYQKIKGEPLKRVTKAACKEVAKKAVGLAGAFKPEGEPTLVRDSDPREALGPAFTAEELAEVAPLPPKDMID